jgi:exonuclease VII small subunit
VRRTRAQLGSTRTEVARIERKLERYFEAFETGELSAALCQERVRSHRERLEALRGQEADLARTLATQAHTSPDAAALAGQLDEILATEGPEQAKELLRLLIREIRVHNRRRIVPTYRVPAAVRAMPSKVGRAGLEPATLGLRARPEPLQRTTRSGNELRQPHARDCNELKQEAASGDEPVLSAVLSPVVSTDNTARSAG